MASRKLITLLCVVVFFVIPCYGQADNKVRVYVYQTSHATTIGRVAPDVYIDDKLVAKVDGGRYFVALLDPGLHTFRSKDKKKGGIEKEFKAGEVYYLRVEIEHAGFFLKFSGISVVQPEQGAYTVKQLRAINSKDIKDKSLVDLSITEETIKK